MLCIIVQKHRSSCRGSRVPSLIPAYHCTLKTDGLAIWTSASARGPSALAGRLEDSLRMDARLDMASTSNSDCCIQSSMDTQNPFHGECCFLSKDMRHPFFPSTENLTIGKIENDSISFRLCSSTISDRYLSVGHQQCFHDIFLGRILPCSEIGCCP
jgi:hypothetical protein